MFTGSPPATGSAAIRTASEEEDEVGACGEAAGAWRRAVSMRPRQLAALAAATLAERRGT
eukprot:4145724-Prymnesium_polylepis.1